VEARRDLLRKLGNAADKDKARRGEAATEALASLTDEHALVRLAAVHTLARVAERGDRSAWGAVAELLHDVDEVVRVGAARAIGRMAEPNLEEAVETLRRTQRDASREGVESLRLAARDAEHRLLGMFGSSGNLLSGNVDGRQVGA